MIRLSNSVYIDEHELDFSAIRAQGAGGQNVNKVSSAIHLRFDVSRSSLPDFYKSKILECVDQRISNDGIVVIKAQNFRSQELNRQDAIERLVELIQSAVKVQKKRVATKPSRAAKRRRTDHKTKRGQTKKLRARVDY